MKADEHSRRVKVGAFLFMGLAALVAGVLLLGSSQSLFVSKVTLYASFENTSGLVVGAPVRLAGIDVGIVRAIGFEKDPKFKRVRVSLAVEKSALERIRADSIAMLSSKGLLGDMLVNISAGDMSAAPLKDGDTLDAQEAAGMSQVIESVETAIGKLESLTTEIDLRLKQVLTDEVAKDIARITASTANVIESVEKGDGLAHTLFYDQELARDASDAVRDLRKTAGRIELAVAHVEEVLAEVEKGDGILNALVYTKGGGKIVGDVERLAKELADAVAEIKTGNGMLHSLIYEEDKTNLVADLAHAAKLVRKVVDEVEQGKGTIGGLLKDPTIYQDLKTVLGNVKRNALLKALVRLTIKNDGLERTGAIEEPASQPAPRK